MSLENAEKGNWPHVINYLDFVHIKCLITTCHAIAVMWFKELII